MYIAMLLEKLLKTTGLFERVMSLSVTYFQGSEWRVERQVYAIRNSHAHRSIMLFVFNTHISSYT